MRIVDLPEIRRGLVYREVIDSMREALVAYSAGECDTPMPMQLGITTGITTGIEAASAAEQAEVHIKASYRRGGKYFALKTAATFPGNLARGLPVGNGMMLLSSAETGEPVAFLADGGHLTDVRTAAVSALMTRELGRQDGALGILGSGIQARLQALMHAEILHLRQIWIWGRSADRVADCCRELAAALPETEISIADSPALVARNTRLIVTATASRQPLLCAGDLQPGSHVSAIGADSVGKQELDPEILRRAALVLVDSRRQCEKLGELQHAPDQWGRAVEMGEYCASRPAVAAAVAPALAESAGITVADFTGLGVEDLYIAEYCFARAF